MDYLLWCKRACALLLVFAATTIAAPAQTFNTLINFNGTNGADPGSPLIQGRDGSFYGTTYYGGADDRGTLFKITPAGVLTSFSFCSQSQCPAGPSGALIQASDGNFYGMTTAGGCSESDGCGTIFTMNPAGELTTIYIFCSQSCSDGLWPQGGLIQGSDGNFYGTTMAGGTDYDCPSGCGTIFKMTPQGTLTTLQVFGQYGFGGTEPLGGLIQATDGNFYVTTLNGGTYKCENGCGTVTRTTPEGLLTFVYNFCQQGGCPDGAGPRAGVIQGTDGNLYGTTVSGGAYEAGTVFKLTLTGKLTTLYSFCGHSGCPDGSGPDGGLIQATDGNFYGTTSAGGLNNRGTVFMMTPSGVLRTLHSFDLTDGADPQSGLLQATSGTFYGTTYSGGDSNCDQCGTLFSLSTGLGPFVSLRRDSGTVGQTSGILGQGFTGATGVSYNGTPASFTVESDTFLLATVPSGATTGYVTVDTSSGPLSSNVPFRVTPQLLTFNPPSGPVGTVVTLTGVSLTQTEQVGFGDYVQANFTVDSDTQVTATVPKGAKTGPIGIETPGGTAFSSGAFTVTP